MYATAVVRVVFGVSRTVPGRASSTTTSQRESCIAILGSPGWSAPNELSELIPGRDKSVFWTPRVRPAPSRES